MNASESLQMSYDHYKCHQLEWLTIAYEYVANMLFLRILGAFIESSQNPENAYGLPL